MKDIFSVVPEDVHISCVTRWRPNEIKMGVSDLQIWDLFKNRPNSDLYLINNLHAKLYKSDEECLIGSSNLTLKALGWTKNHNLEILMS